jgi:hypothetical protein
MSAHIPGCHGVAVTPPEIGLELGWLTVEPPFAAVVEVVDRVERSSAAELVWQLDEPPGFGLPAITSQTWQEPNERIWVGNDLNLSLRVDYASGVVSVAARNRSLQVVLEGLANIALPLIAQRGGSLVLHAAAACREGAESPAFSWVL